MSLMKSEPKKVFIKIDSSEDQENAVNSRKSFKDLKNSNLNKENIDSKYGLKLIGQGSESVLKRKRMVHRAIQTGEITDGDLTSDSPSIDYWKTLAETRANQLEESFSENEKLKEQVDHLEEENKVCKEMLEESRTLVEVLQEILSESNAQNED